MIELAISFITLSVLEIVLGIDNMLVIAILSGRLQKHQQASARIAGLAIAMLTRVLLLCSISWLARLKTTLFSLGSLDVSWRDIILLAGGVFLLWKAGSEIYEMVEVSADHDGEAPSEQAPTMGFASCVTQIVLLDIVFSLDSVITAVGLSNHLGIMVSAVITGAISMMFFTGALAEFVRKNPSIKVLALAFLVLVGLFLALESFHVEISKGYLYCAMGFSFAVELLHLRRRRNAKARKLSGVEQD